MSLLSDKITSYTHEYGVEFNQAYTTNPTFTGTNAPTGTPYFLLNNTAPTYEATVGPAGGSGSWRINQTSGINGTRLRSNTTNVPSTWQDGDYSTGIWIKFNSLPTGTGSYNIHSVFPASSATGFSLSIIGSGSTINPSKFASNLVPGSTFSGGFGPTIVVGEWYYIATRKTMTTNTAQHWINGTLVVTGNNQTTGTNNSFDFGTSILQTTTYSFNFSNFYMATAAQITSTEIAEIWTAGSPPPATNINYTNTSGATATALIVDPVTSVNSNAEIVEAPATADAIFAEPTIIVTTPDYTQITTSIVASVLFPDATVQTSSFVNNTVDPLLASADIINNVDIQTGTDVSFGAQEMTASAEMTMPFLPSPLIASATMVHPTITIPQSYFNYVMQNSPLIYFNQFPTGNSVSWPNYGSLNLGVVDKGPIGLSGGSSTQVASGVPLSNVGDGFSLGTADQINYFDKSGYATPLANVYITKNWTHEFWYKPATGSTYNYTDDVVNMTISHTSSSVTANILFREANLGTIFDATITNASSLLTNGNWHHVALVASNFSSTQIRLDLYVDSVFMGVSIQNFNATLSGIYNQLNAGSNEMTWTFGSVGAALYDEIVVYPSALSSQTLSTKYNFVDSISPNRNVGADPITATALMLDANVIIVSNINNQETPATASSLFVQPIIIAGRTINATADPMLASATNTDAIAYWGRTYFATPMISAAESKEGFVLNDIYYNYVQANIAPYRYVSFDAADTSLDYGIDNDYSVTPTTVGGTIVNPDLGINGKSAKTAGTSYITDGVILKESEWNDSWGTGVNSYHSAFWFQRALDDASTTGLRVLWNLNGYKDNQHVVLYQYQDKLHMQFNNGSGTWIEQDTGTLDLFDYNRHFIVINFNNVNPVNNIITIYVDSVLKMTVNLGSYTGSTTNASSADSGPNNEANNHPRLSIGCLITPFASTALPVVPTNTKLIVDEIYWDKNAIDQTTVTNLFNIMPGKFNINFAANVMTASDEFVMPAFATTVNFLTDPFTASVELVEPVITADREVIYTANAMTATGLMANAEVNENRTISADFMQAVATFNDPGVQITIPGGPMLASAKIVKPALVNDVIVTDLTSYMRYLRAQNFSGNQINRLIEVK